MKHSKIQSQPKNRAKEPGKERVQSRRAPPFAKARLFYSEPLRTPSEKAVAKKWVEKNPHFSLPPEIPILLVLRSLHKRDSTQHS